MFFRKNRWERLSSLALLANETSVATQMIKIIALGQTVQNEIAVKIARQSLKNQQI